MARVEAIDFAKGVAITSIMIFHCYEAIFAWPGHDLFSFLEGGLLSAYAFDTAYVTNAFNTPIDSWGFNPTVKGLLKLTGLGYQGVSVFVVLSGFLQMWAYRDRKMNFYKYYFKRFLRLYPLYWLVLLGIIAINMVWNGNPGATGAQIAWAFVGWVILLPLNPSFWFMILIIQLYLLFPLLSSLLSHFREIRFLIGMWMLSVVFLYLFTYRFPLAGIFFGCWIFEFSLGMVMANHYSKVNSMLRGVKTMILFFLLYLLGLYLSSFAITWPVGRPLYGTGLTLLLWSIYNTIKEVNVLKILKRAFVFIGLNSFAMYLINQPFIQEYFVLVTGQHLFFENRITGSDMNFISLPISRYLLTVLSYAIVIIFLSCTLTKIDNYLGRRLSSWQPKISTRRKDL